MGAHGATYQNAKLLAAGLHISVRAEIDHPGGSTPFCAKLATESLPKRRVGRKSASSSQHNAGSIDCRLAAG